MERSILSLILLLALSCAFPALADHHEPGTEDPAGPDMAAMEAAWQEAMTPGDHHAFLAGLEGDWSFTSTVWMDPSQPPMKTPGTSKKTMILDGRYLQEETVGEMMGRPFHGRGITAYDNVAGEFINTWIDDMGTGVAVAKGERNGNTLELHGEYLDPMSKQAMKVRYVIEVIDKDHHVFRYLITMPGAPEFKSMEIEYSRK